jgi:hypothetical protein
MKFFALIVVLAAWMCLFLAPRGTVSRLLQFLIFGLLGIVFTLAGVFQYWWNSGMQPSQKSAFLLICGLLTLASQLGTLVFAVFGGEGGTEWPRRGRDRE